MCGVWGAIVNRYNDSVESTLTEIFAKSAERGSDSWGLSYFNDRHLYTQKSCDRASPSFAFLKDTTLPVAVIGNRRGEPTSEWVLQKSHANIQPFSSPKCTWAVTHNGCISNDKEILSELHITPPTSIDSYAIGAAIEHYGFRGAFQERLNSGSAFAILTTNQFAADIHFATNYKPLFVRKFNFGYVFASQAEYLMSVNENLDTLINNCSPVEIPCYTGGTFTSDGRIINEFDLYRSKGSVKKVLVSCSGGLDSSTVAWMYHKQGHDVDLFHLKYNCHAETREIKAVRDLAEVMHCEVHEVTTDFFSKCAPSSLTEDRGINDENGEEIATEWVPARNTVLYALALAFAEAHNYDIIALGGNVEESGAFPDNEQEFTNKWNALSPYAVKPYHKIEITSPFAAKVKHQIVKIGLELGMPYELTYSCYKGEEQHCGVCGPCRMRARAFEMNGTTDPVMEHLDG